ncbi:hypothetical protein [Microbacterium sp. TWP3-1-2b2]|uniref:hypothetical protein n=1 Tax=Microbacterium sp. TWP3-1-2b2 TaxID=2804651 RepID=UPI003CF186A4
MARIARIWGGLVMATLLVGCAPQAPASPGEVATPAATPTPTAACPQVEGVELPPECAPYDPDQAMAQNERYRDRMEISAEAAAAAEALAGPLRRVIDALRTSSTISIDAVEQAIMDAGLERPQIREDYGDVLFGVAGPEGGCVFGAVTADAVSVEVGGNIMDGGCLPAQ